jgi:hypothetical protein
MYINLSSFIIPYAGMRICYIRIGMKEATPSGRDTGKEEGKGRNDMLKHPTK